jgi:hypothetical protein
MDKIRRRNPRLSQAILPKDRTCIMQRTLDSDD